VRPILSGTTASLGALAWRAAARSRRCIIDDCERICSCQASKNGELVARGIGAVAEDLSVPHEQRKAMSSFKRDGLQNPRLIHERLRILGKAKPSHHHTAPLQPLNIRRKLDEIAIHILSADASRTAHRGLENIELFHDLLTFGYPSLNHLYSRMRIY
jgi:hypothetical protein